MTHILLIEDEPHQGLMLKEELEDAGYGVNLVDNGHAAVKQLQEGERPDLVVLDIAMPGMDGIETLGKLLAEDNQLPVILHTAYAQYKNNFMSWAADAYVVKSPSDLQGLKGEIERVLAERGRGQDTRNDTENA